MDSCEPPTVDLMSTIVNGNNSADRAGLLTAVNQAPTATSAANPVAIQHQSTRTHFTVSSKSTTSTSASLVTRISGTRNWRNSRR